MKETIYKLSQLVSVEIQDKFKTPLLVWDDTHKLFEARGENGWYSADDLLEGKWANRPLLVINNIAYEKPNVLLKFSNNSRYLKIFSSYENALLWGREISEAPAEKTFTVSKEATD